MKKGYISYSRGAQIPGKLIWWHGTGYLQHNNSSFPLNKECVTVHIHWAHSAGYKQRSRGPQKFLSLCVELASQYTRIWIWPLFGKICGPLSYRGLSFITTISTVTSTIRKPAFNGASRDSYTVLRTAITELLHKSWSIQYFVQCKFVLRAGFWYRYWF
jgi:hypothetical protein